jgi:hypothetical protein
LHGERGALSAIVAGDLGVRTLDNDAFAGRVLILTNPTEPQFRVLPYAPRTTHWGNHANFSLGVQGQMCGVSWVYVQDVEAHRRSPSGLMSW